MNWEAIGAAGQVLGSVAVFVTLGYLAVLPHLDDLPSADRDDFDRAARATYGRQSLDRLWYDTSKAALNPAAVAYIDKLLAEPLAIRAGTN